MTSGSLTWVHQLHLLAAASHPRPRHGHTTLPCQHHHRPLLLRTVGRRSPAGRALRSRRTRPSSNLGKHKMGPLGDLLRLSCEVVASCPAPATKITVGRSGGGLRPLVQAVDELLQHQHHVLRRTWPHSVRITCPRWCGARSGLCWSGRSFCTLPPITNGQRPPPSFSCSAVQPSMTVRRPASVTLRGS